MINLCLFLCIQVFQCCQLPLCLYHPSAALGSEFTCCKRPVSTFSPLPHTQVGHVPTCMWNGYLHACGVGIHACGVGILACGVPISHTYMHSCGVPIAYIHVQYIYLHACVVYLLHTYMHACAVPIAHMHALFQCVKVLYIDTFVLNSLISITIDCNCVISL